MLRLMPRPLQFAFQSAGPQPARSLSGRLCRDASSPLPPSPDVGKFIRGAAFPTARAGLRRPQMRSAALFRPPDGFSARLGNVAAPCGGVHSGSGDEPPARSLSGRLCRDASSSRPPSPDVGKFIRGHRLSDRPCGIAVSADAVRSGMLPPRGPLSPVRRIFGTPRHVAAPCVRCPPAPHSPGDQAPPPPGRRSCDRTAPEAPSPSRCGSASPARRPECMRLVRRCVPLARSAKFARAQPAAFARIMRYARPLRMFACSETAPHET